MRKQIKLTREELYRKIWEKPTVKVAAEFGISDVGLAKICRKMNVPKPPPGYWRRIETGAQITATPLPEISNATAEFVFINISDSSDKVSQEIQAEIDQKYSPENRIKIAENLTESHPLVRKTQEFYEQQTDNKSVELPTPPSDKGYPNISVSLNQSHRALLIMDAVFKAAENRGYTVLVSTDYWGEKTRIMKEGEELQFALYESVRQIQRTLTPEEKKKPPYLLIIQNEYKTEGKLTVKINQRRWSVYQKWSDLKHTPLENRLNDILAGIVAMLESLVYEKRKRDDEERGRKEIIRQREEEKQKRENLEADVSRWRKSRNIDDYLDAYEARLIKEKVVINPNSPEAEWLTWARRYAASLNPLNKMFSEDK